MENDSENHQGPHDAKPYDCDLLRTSQTSSHNLTIHKSVSPGKHGLLSCCCFFFCAQFICLIRVYNVVIICVFILKFFTLSKLRV